MSSIATDVARLEVSAPIELFELDATPVGGEIFRFTNMGSPTGGSVWWQGLEYQPFPIEASGFDLAADGPLARPRLMVANVTGLIGALIREYQRLEGCKVIRRRTLLRYLDTVNFPDGNAWADPTAGWPDEIWEIDRVDKRNRLLVEWELCSPIDVAGVQLPRRQIQASACTWRYRGSECGYTGGAVAKADDTPTSNTAEDACGRRISSCKLRFGASGELPFGGFPGAGITRNA